MREDNFQCHGSAEAIPDSDVRFDHAPYFNFNDDKVKFDTNELDNVNDNYGTASAFLPKSLLN